MYSTGKLLDGKGVVTNAKGGTSYHNHGLAINEDNIENIKIIGNYGISITRDT